MCYDYKTFSMHRIGEKKRKPSNFGEKVKNYLTSFLFAGAIGQQAKIFKFSTKMFCREYEKSFRIQTQRNIDAFTLRVFVGIPDTKQCRFLTPQKLFASSLRTAKSLHLLLMLQERRNGPLLCSLSVYTSSLLCLLLLLLSSGSRQRFLTVKRLQDLQLSSFISAPFYLGNCAQRLEYFT